MNLQLRANGRILEEQRMLTVIHVLVCNYLTSVKEQSKIDGLL